MWYKKPAASWSEALPVGNGRLGGMVYGNPLNEMIQLNEDSVWSGKPLDRHNPDALHKLPEIRRLLREGKVRQAEKLALYAMSGVPNSQRSYQTAGELYINMDEKEEILDYRRELDLESGMVRVQYKTEGGSYEREVLSSYPDGVMVVHLKAEGKQLLNFSCNLGRKHNWTDEVSRKNGNQIGFHVDGGTEGISFCVMLRVEQQGGSISALGEFLVIENAKEATLYLGIETSFRHEEYQEICERRLEEAERKGFAAIRREHIEDFSGLFNRVKLSFDKEEHTMIPTDERLKMLKEGGEDVGLVALHFQYGRYLLISSSRDGSLPANLQGIWNDSLTPPWESKYTININLEMNYWLAESGNLSECHLPYFDFLERIKENGKKTAKVMYGCRGSVAHHNADIYADTAPQDHYPPASLWVLGEAWLATHLWEHYQYTQDKEFLEKHFDILEQSVLFFYDFLIEGKDGTLVTSPSVSPENTYIMQDGSRGTMCEGPTMDNQILTELLKGYINACQILEKDEEEIAKAEKVLSRLPKMKIGKHGQLMEWMEDYDEEEPGHRHISHLYAVYPGTTLTYEDTPELMQAAKIALERRLSYGGGHTGWSRAWMIGLWARFKEAENAYEDYLALLRQSTFPNMMDNHPMSDGYVFQIDGNFGAAAALLEMLVQSHGERVVLLPALPRAMENGEVQGICVRGGAVMDMKWKAGNITYLRIVPVKEQRMRLYVNGKEMLLELKQGQEVVLEN